MKIGPLKKVSKEALADISSLIGQLRGTEKKLGTLSELRAIVENKNTVMVVARDGQRIVGVATLYVLQKVGKRTGRIEDVVVDSEYRGKGIGKGLVKEVIRTAKKLKLAVVHLTSRPEKIAANALYKKLGFTIKKTNPYSLHF